MKRSLGIIFSLMMIMTAFMGCEMETEETYLPYVSSGYKPGDVVLIDNLSFYYTLESTTKIKRNHFSIGIVDSSGNINSDSFTPIETLKVKVEISRDGGNKWDEVVFNTTAYGKVGEVVIKVTRTDAPSRYVTLKLTIYE